MFPVLGTVGGVLPSVSAVFGDSAMRSYDSCHCFICVAHSLHLLLRLRQWVHARCSLCCNGKV